MKRMKKLIALFLVVILVIFSGNIICGFNVAEAETLGVEVKKTEVEKSQLTMGVSAHAYVVIDANSGEVIMSQDMDKQISPASTTKLLTAVVALENCDLNKEVVVTKSALNRVDWESAIIGLKVGSTYKMEELLYMLLLVSAADAAEVIAEEVGGTHDEFINMMNKKAQELGMNNSYFDNPVGMDWHIGANIYSTANDISKLTRYAMTNYKIRKIVRQPFYTIESFNNGAPKKIGSTNGFLRKRKYSKNLFTVIGSKTGTSDKAGFALTTTAKDCYGREVICTFFGNSTRTKMYHDINRLLTNTFKNHKDELVSGLFNIRYPSLNYVLDQDIEKSVIK